MVSYFVEADCQLLAQLELRSDNGLTIESSEDDFVLIITVVHLHPHPLRLARVFILKFNFYVIASSVDSHS